MALFNDGPISGITDLMNYETSILDLASTEGIDTAAKMQLAQDEISAELLRFLLNSDDGCQSGWDYSANTSLRREVGTGDVVVTSALRRWHTLRTLAMVYRDAYNNQLNDRYQGKWKTYDRLQADAMRTYLETGVGLVTTPAPKPDPPVVSTVPGSSAAGTYYFCSSWVTTNGEEGLCSEAAVVSVFEGTQPLIGCAAAPPGVAGWNVYAGTAADDLGLQNDAPLAIGDQVAQTTPLRQGRAPGEGQTPDRWVVDERRLRRR